MQNFLKWIYSFQDYSLLLSLAAVSHPPTPPPVVCFCLFSIICAFVVSLFFRFALVPTALPASLCRLLSVPASAVPCPGLPVLPTHYPLPTYRCFVRAACCFLHIPYSRTRSHLSLSSLLLLFIPAVVVAKSKFRSTCVALADFSSIFGPINSPPPTMLDTRVLWSLGRSLERCHTPIFSQWPESALCRTNALLWFPPNPLPPVQKDSNNVD